MDDDFFKDLVPIKATSVNRAASKNHETSSIFSDDAVLSAVPDGKPSAEHIRNESNDTLPHPMTGPMGEPRQKKEVREMESAMQGMLESTFKRFAGGLQKVLEDVQQRLERLEGQTSRISDQLQELSEDRAGEEGTHAQRFDAIFTSLRDVQRGVQVVRDKQELIEAQAELAKFAPLKKQEKAEDLLPKAEAPKASEEAAPAPKPAEVAPAPAPPAAPAPAPPAPPAALPAAPAPPAAPAAPPMPTAPQQQETSFGGQTAQQALPPSPSLPVYSAGPQMPSMLSTPFVPSMPGFQGDRPMGPPAYAPPPPPQQQQQQHPGEPPSQNPFSGAPPPPQPYPQAPPPPPQFPGPPEALQRMQYSQAPPPQPNAQYDGYSQSPRPATPPAAPYFRPPPPPMSRMDSYGPPPPQPPPPSFARTSAGYPTFSRPPPDAPPPPQQGSYGGYGGPPAPQLRPPAPQPSQPSAAPTTRSVPLEKVIDDVSSMGFSRHEVHGVISDLMDNGQSVDLNVVLDRLMRARG